MQYPYLDIDYLVLLLIIGSPLSFIVVANGIPCMNNNYYQLTVVP